MEIDYRTSTDGIEPNDLRGFFVGWPNPPNPQAHLKIHNSSSECVLAVDHATGRVIGYITAITDGVMSAFIPHLEVLPEFRGEGVGTELTRRMLSRLESYYSVDLSCDPELQPFYERLGMKPHTAMLIRNHHLQNAETIDSDLA